MRGGAREGSRAGGEMPRLNADGLPQGEHALFLVVIDGVDADGWDVVTHSMPIRVGVD